MVGLWYNEDTTSNSYRGGIAKCPPAWQQKGKFPMPLHDTAVAPGLKVCTKCGKSKPATTEFFFRQKNTRDGLCPSCKECKRAYNAATRIQISERHHAHYARNKESIKRRALAYHFSNRNERLDKQRVYRAEHKEDAARRDRDYYIRNKRRMNEQARAWRLANREAENTLSRRKRARKRNAPGSHTVDDVKKQYRAQKGKCYYCHIEVGDRYHIDHVIPLARGGSDGAENIVVACPTCNLQKGRKLPSEWSEGGRLI